VSDKEKLSWREIDQRRDGARSGRPGPRGEAAKERSEQATKQYLSEIDKLFSGSEGGEEGEALARAIRDAHGSSELDTACQAHREILGLPRELELLSIFLDCKETKLVVEALEALLVLQNGGDISLSRGIQSQIRVLAQSFDNDVAEIAEEILEQM
jgi:hypothetical protein